MKGEVSRITPVASSPWEGKGAINMPSKSLSTLVFALLLEENICLTDFQVGNGCTTAAAQCGCGDLHGGFGYSPSSMMSLPSFSYEEELPQKMQIQNHAKSPFLTKSREPMEKCVQRR